MKDEKSSQSACLPPTTYNLSERAFRPGLSFGQPIEGLNDTVMRLYNEGRLRSALDAIFKVLDKDPDNPQALDMALIVAGGLRTTQIQAQEPLTPAYLLDRRLDPIVTVCSRCGNSWIGGDPLLLPGFQNMLGIIMINSGAPRPMQCYNCGYVLCSECIIAINSDDPLDPQDIPENCPKCGQDKLKRPAYPTGRPPQQMARHSEPVAQIIVFREGPVPPDEVFLKRFIEPISPDALTDRAKLVGIPVFPWPSSIEATSLITLAQKEARGEIPTGSVERAEFAHARDEQGNRIYIAKLLMPPSKAGYRNLPKRTSLNLIPYLIEDWTKSFIGWMYFIQMKIIPSPEEKSVEDIIRFHISRMIESMAGRPNSTVESHYRSLLHPPTLAFTQKTIVMKLQRSLATNQHHWESHRIGGMFLIISTVPVVVPTRARAYFQGSYLEFLDTQIQGSAIQIGTTSIAHWVYCSDGLRTGLHLTLFPKEGVAVFAQDLLTETEKSQLGL